MFVQNSLCTCAAGMGQSEQVLKEFNVDVAGPRLMVGVDVGHQRVSRAVHAFADDAAIFLLSLRMFVSDVSLQRCFRTQHFPTQLTREHFLQRAPCNTAKTLLAFFFLSTALPPVDLFTHFQHQPTYIQCTPLPLDKFLKLAERSTFSHPFYPTSRFDSPIHVSPTSYSYKLQLQIQKVVQERIKSSGGNSWYYFNVYSCNHHIGISL